MGQRRFSGRHGAYIRQSTATHPTIMMVYYKARSKALEDAARNCWHTEIIRTGQRGLHKLEETAFVHPGLLISR